MVAKASGRIVLERANGQEIAYMDIGMYQPELILPGGEREFRMAIPTLDKGRFRIRAEISPGPGGGEKAIVEEEFETYTEIPEGLRDTEEAAGSPETVGSGSDEGEAGESAVPRASEEKKVSS
jgi:hypothetical protein